MLHVRIAIHLLGRSLKCCVEDADGQKAKDTAVYRILRNDNHL
jgi:hypothetical protein